MSLERARYEFYTVRRKFLLLRWFECILLGSTVSALVGGVVRWAYNLNAISVLIWMVGVTCIAVLILAWYRKLFSSHDEKIISLLNCQHPELEQSLDLVFRTTADLTRIQQLQQGRVTERLEKIYPQVKIPNHVASSAAALVGSIVMYVVLSGFSNPHGFNEAKQIISREQPKPEAVAPGIRKTVITISPPAYTGIKQQTSGSLNIQAPQGSAVFWSIQLDNPADFVRIVIGGTDSLATRKDSDRGFQASARFDNSTFYQITWSVKGQYFQSDYYKLEIVKDQVPKVLITNLAQFIQRDFDDPSLIEIKASVQDDYGLKDAAIIATVSKGSGESVKFREEKIRFTNPLTVQGKQINASVKVSLQKLGMDPGDELYFYVEAEDNKTPEANKNRTETYFIAIRDTATYEAVEDDGLGVDLMPEYFRSQRQIIIDTEKLLAQRKKISKQQFNATSNELGYDQKVLRLRYGQFLGEEADSGIAHGDEPEEEHEEHDEEEEEDPIKKFGHQHDNDNEHNLVEEKKPEHHHHGEEEDDEEDPMKKFIHSHDNAEEATFFIQSIRAKLKAALTVMWDAELYLRLFEPEKSLPFQYKALNLLKEISNDSRIYVHRMGFDPPPLKEEKRLTADLTEVKASRQSTSLEQKILYPAIVEAARWIDQKKNSSQAVTAAEIKLLNQVGAELSVIILDNPGPYLEGLSQIRKLTNGQLTIGQQQQTLEDLQKTLWQVLPTEPIVPSPNQKTLHHLEEQFLKSHTH